MSRSEKLLDLIKHVQSRRLQPEDHLEIVALLEAMGWSDDRAKQSFGVAHLFELAIEIWEHMQQNFQMTPYSPVPKQSLKALSSELFHQFFRGVIFALPMAVSIIAMLTLKFSLWSYENLSVDIATSIGVGTIISFIVVGGFTQAIARRGFYYVMLGYYNMARRMTFYFVRMGLIVCLLVCLLIYVINLIFILFPGYMITIIILYYFFLNCIWLSVTVFYILKKEIVFTGLIILGIAIVWLLFGILQIATIIVSQLIALSIISFIGIMLVNRYFREAEKKMDKGISPQMPRMSITLYSTIPYFVYGLLYFAFLFVDRIFAWSTPDEYIPYVVWFRGPYEIGLDFALMVLIIPMGVSEVLVSKLMQDMQASQKGYLGIQTREMNRLFVRKYRKQFIVMSAVVITSAFLLYGLADWFFHLYPELIGIQLFTNSTTRFVFIWAIVGYVLVAVSLMNVVILFCLAQARMVSRIIVPAFVTNLLVGYVASRWAHFIIGNQIMNNPGYAYAVFGLVAGSVIFAVLSTRYVLKLLRNLDYYMNVAT